MSSNERFTPPRKKHNVLWWIGGAFLLLVVLFLFQLFGPSPRIVVSPQTTFITEPLGPNGLPDYERYILELSREGVTPENNAAVLIWQALFPGELDPKFHAAIADELGLSQLPFRADSLEPLQGKANRLAMAALLAERASTIDNEDKDGGPSADDKASFWNDPNSPAVEQVLEQAMRRPWKSADLPPLADWAATNETPLNLLVAASRRPRYYFPSPTLLNDERELLVEMLLPHVQSVREAGRSLAARAMWHLGEGRPEQAWRDLLALHRLSFLVSQGHWLVEQLVATAMSGIACEGSVTLLHEAKLTPEQARTIQRNLAALPNFAVMARSLDETERLAALDAIVRLGSGSGEEMFSALGGQGDFGGGVFDVVSIDWNYVLRNTNRWYDQLVEAVRSQDRLTRTAALAKFDAKIQKLYQEARSPGRMLAGVVSRQQRSEFVSAMMLSLFVPALPAVTNAEDRANTTLELTRVAAALAVYRAEHGEYPEKLEALVPNVVEKLPADLYHAKPLLYKRLADGFLLYSAGENGVDDGGSNAQMEKLHGKSLNDLDKATKQQSAPMIPAGADDSSIRAERRVFEWPRRTPTDGEP